MGAHQQGESSERAVSRTATSTGSQQAEQEEQALEEAATDSGNPEVGADRSPSQQHQSHRSPSSGADLILEELITAGERKRPREDLFCRESFTLS